MLQRPEMVVGAIVTRGKQVLLLKRNNAHGTGNWCAPAGHLEFGESFEECAVRETKEETSVDIQIVRFKGITNSVFKEDRIHYVTIWMEAIFLSGEAVITSPTEVAEISWFNWEALPRPLFLPFESLLHNESYPSVENDTISIVV